MANPRKFKSNSGGHVSIWYGPASDHYVDIPAEGTYETGDERELEALKASSEVSEVRSSPKGDSKKD